MESELEAISGIRDVSYLLTRLRLAKRKNQTEIKEAIVKRLKDMDVLKDAEAVSDAPFRNLRVAVNNILGSDQN